MPDPMMPRPRNPIFIGVAMIFLGGNVSSSEGRMSGRKS